jgi:hypothetical protein
MFEAALFLYLFQVHDPATPYPLVRRQSPEMHQSAPDFWAGEETSPISGDALKREARYEEDEFAKRFNGLLTALSDFASSYNSGHTINVKKVNAVRKAWRELEKSDWFRPRKGD